MNSMPFWHTQRGAGVSTPYAAGEEPLRAELLNAEQMEERGREIAAQHKTRTARVAANPLLQRLAQKSFASAARCSPMRSRTIRKSRPRASGCSITFI
jgi:hypothetical protein